MTASRPYRTVLRAGADRAAWLSARRAGLGGSDAAAVLGWGGYSSALDVYTDKVTDIRVDDEDREATAWGRLLEDVIAREWARREHRQIRQAPALVQSTRWPWMLASLDRLVVDDKRRPVAPLEVKNRSSWVAHDWDDEPPPDVTAQTLHYLAVYDLRVAYIACLVGGNELRTYTVTAEEQLLADIAEAERLWWDGHVVARVLPPLTGGDNADALRRLHPHPDGVLDLDLDGIDLLRRRAKANEAYTETKSERAAVDDQVRLLLGDKIEGHIGGTKFVQWAPGDGSRSTDYDRLLTDFPDAYRACVTTSGPTRRLTYSKKAIPS